MIICLNKHILVAPIPHSDFVEGNEKLEPMGTVLAVGAGVDDIAVNDVVYFEEFMAKKFPGEQPDTFLWFVPANEVCGKK